MRLNTLVCIHHVWSKSLSFERMGNWLPEYTNGVDIKFLTIAWMRSIFALLKSSVRTWFCLLKSLKDRSVLQLPSVPSSTCIWSMSYNCWEQCICAMQGMRQPDLLTLCRIQFNQFINYIMQVKMKNPWTLDLESHATFEALVLQMFSIKTARLISRPGWNLHTATRLFQTKIQIILGTEIHFSYVIVLIICIGLN